MLKITKAFGTLSETLDAKNNNFCFSFPSVNSIVPGLFSGFIRYIAIERYINPANLFKNIFKPVTFPIYLGNYYQRQFYVGIYKQEYEAICTPL